MLRKRAGLTQQQLADKVDFGVSAVGNWESGLNMPSRTAMRKISAVLGTTEMFLSGESDIDAGAYIETPTQYSGALRFSEMTERELQFIYDSRQKELGEAREAQRRRELLGVISEIAGEMQKRIPQVKPKKSPEDQIAEAVEEVAGKPPVQHESK